MWSAGLATLPVWCGCHKEGQPTVIMPERPPAMVTAAPAVVQDVPVYLEQIGKIVPVESVSVMPQVGGRILSAPVADGAYVTKGQLLFEIDPRPFEAALASAQASLAQNKALLELARAEFNRVKEVAESAVSRLEYDQKKNAVAVAEARVAGAEATLASAKLDLEYSRIIAPLDGRAGARFTFAGNVVRPSEGPLLVIQRMDPIYAEFTITENDLGTVRRFMATSGLDLRQSVDNGLRAEVSIPADSIRVLAALGSGAAATQAAGADKGPRTGAVTFLDNTVQPGTGTVKLRATLPNGDRRLWPGQFVNVRLILTTKTKAVLVPVIAQQIGQQGPFVYVVSPENTAELRPIVPGQRQGELLVVERGVRPGESVILTGHMSITPNGKVMVTNGTAGAMPPGAAAGAPAGAS